MLDTADDHEQAQEEDQQRDLHVLHGMVHDHAAGDEDESSHSQHSDEPGFPMQRAVRHEERHHDAEDGDGGLPESWILDLHFLERGVRGRLRELFPEQKLE